jgi:putative Mg2+ transporter-C (MgtC) family protein
MRAPARRIGGLCCCLLFVLAGSVPGRRLRVDLIVGVLAVHRAPTALQGALVGIGFIGAGLVFRQPKGRLPLIRNRTTAAAIFAAAAIGAAAGEGRLLLATVGTALALLVLEVRHIPLLRPLDGRSWAPRFRDDESPRRPDEAAADDPQCEAGDH